MQTDWSDIWQVWQDMQSTGVRANTAILTHFYLALAHCKLSDQQQEEAWQEFLDFRKDNRIDSRLATACLTFCRCQADGAGVMHIWKFLEEVIVCLILVLQLACC